MGEGKGSTFKPDFNRSVKVEFDDQRLKSNAARIILDAISSFRSNRAARGPLDARRGT